MMTLTNFLINDPMKECVALFQYIWISKATCTRSYLL